MKYDSKRYALVNRWDERHTKTVGRLLQPRPGEKILEVGAGRGHLTKRLIDLGVDAVGIDANPHASEMAVSDAVVTMRAERLDFADESFDKVVSVHAIEHVPEIEGALAEMARVLKPGGIVLLIYPAEPIQGIWAIPTAVILHGNPFKARQVHCHWLWPAKMRRLTGRAGLRETHSEFNLLSSPQFVSVYSKG